MTQKTHRLTLGANSELTERTPKEHPESTHLTSRTPFLVGTHTSQVPQLTERVGEPD